MPDGAGELQQEEARMVQKAGRTPHFAAVPTPNKVPLGGAGLEAAWGRAESHRKRCGTQKSLHSGTSGGMESGTEMFPGGEVPCTEARSTSR